MASARRIGHHRQVAVVGCQVVRWVADEPQPGLVEAQLTDSDGRLWSFIDKVPVFLSDGGRPARFPATAAIRCQIIQREILPGGREVIVIDTASPDGVDSNGVTTFRVPAAAVSPPVR